MEELKQGWKKRISWLVIALIVVIVYKMLDNFSYIKEWIGTFLRILRPFLIGLLLSYILFIPCRKIERILKNSKKAFIRKRCRGISVFLTFILAFLLIIIIINCIVPVLRESIVELFANIQGYYDTVVYKFDELPDDSILKSDFVKEAITSLQSIDFKELLSINNEKIIEYAKNVINVFTGIFDIFVSIVVSAYLLLQRTTIMNFLRKLTRAIFKNETYKTIDKYFVKANEVFFSFISSQLLDAVVVGVLITLAMLILKVRYAPLLGFLIGLFNMIPYIGAIVAVIIAIIITLITGGLGQTIAMSIVIIILQQIDANIINPKIVGHSLQVSPLLVIFAVTVGGAYFGIIGMFLAVPIAVVIKTMILDFIEYKNKIRDNEEKILKE